MSIELQVDLTNPGQFFACCGLFEIAERLSGTATAWFEPGVFHIETEQRLTLSSCLDALAAAKVRPHGDGDVPFELQFGTTSLLLDWWKDRQSGGARLKTWAGQQECHRIASAMLDATAKAPPGPALLAHGQVVFENSSSKEKVEPFYFDVTRGASGQALDVGFSPNDLKHKSIACPATEFLCLVGIQRFRPQETNERRVFKYFIWEKPYRPLVASVVLCGATTTQSPSGYLFANESRAKDYKSFSTATPLGKGNT